MFAVTQPVMTTRLTALQSTSTHADDAGPVDDVISCQPLSLEALMDYKTQLAAPGHGQFALGHVRLWPVQ